MSTVRIDLNQKMSLRREMENPHWQPKHNLHLVNLTKTLPLFVLFHGFVFIDVVF